MEQDNKTEKIENKPEVTEDQQAFWDGVEKDNQINAKRKEIYHDKTILDYARTKAELEQYEIANKDLELLKNADFGTSTKSEISDIQKENSEYMEYAKHRFSFILSDEKSKMGFDKIVPFFRKNIILIGALTGSGKSTAVSNIIFHLMKQKNRVTGKSPRILLMTNEERKEDVYNRITCLINGWHYVNHDQFTKEQVEIFNKFIPNLATRLKVIDNIYQGAHGATTTLEGFKNIMDNLIKNKEYYDVVIIDYYQNYISSIANPTMGINEVQATIARLLDNYKNVYPAPFVVMSQLNPETKENGGYFPNRIQGRKLLPNMSTLVMEMIVDKDNRLTKWKVHKSRFSEAEHMELITGYDKGRFVHYTEEFRNKVQEMRDRYLQKTIENKLNDEDSQKFKEIQGEVKKENEQENEK